MKAAIFFVVGGVLAAQDFSQRGFLETTGYFFPQTVPGDSSHAINETLLRYEAFFKAGPSLRFAAEVDARIDSHQESERRWHLSWWDRERRRPSFDMRRLSATYTAGRLTVEAGRQFIRWGKTDVVNPTDRFAPRDYVNVVDNDFLGVMAVRTTYGSQENTLDLIYSPRFTPSRVPLIEQRWGPMLPAVQVLEK